MKLDYPEGKHLKIFIKNEKIYTLTGYFYMKGSTWPAEYLDLSDKIDTVDVIRMQRPNMTEIYSTDAHIFIEHFDSLTILDGILIIEI